jgi:iron complex outermembrane receptor protein
MVFAGEAPVAVSSVGPRALFERSPNPVAGARGQPDGGSMSRRLFHLFGGSVAAILASAPGALAATAPDSPGAATGVSELVVTADKVGLLEKRPNNTVFGLDKPLVDTPRSASLISALTIQRYGVDSINKLVTIAPGTFTASFYGVAGSLNIRGTYAENYFQGFKLIENLGTYTTPVGDAAQIEVVRGPPSPIYGPGRVGGFLNFIPKSASVEGDYLKTPTAEIDATIGAYQKKNLTAQGGLPITLGDVHGGLYAYGELDDSHSYYRGIYPKHQMGEFSARFDFPDQWTVSLDAMFYHSSGDVQTPGWNRLTQDLIDNQTYITGRNTALSNTPGVPYLAPGQVTIPPGYYPYLYSPTGNAGLSQAYFGYPLGTDPRFVLDSGVGTTTLSRRDVYLSPYDFSDTKTPTVYFGLQKSGLPGDGVAKLELFYTGLTNRRFVSYGFPAWLRANVLEARASYDAKFTAVGGLISVNNIVGLADRHSQARDMQSFNSGVIALDRRDISQGWSPTDTICSPFVGGVTGDSIPYKCLGWEQDIHSKINDVGLFDTVDISVAKRLDLVLGGREDYYHVKSSDSGILSYETAGPVSASKWMGSYSLSASYKLGYGLMPYFTYAENSALEYGQAGDISTSLIQNGGWLRNSELTEAGVKFQALNGALVGSLDYYRQSRPVLTGTPPRVVNTIGKGEELEIRYVASRHISVTFAGNLQHTEVIGPDESFQYIPAYTVCGANLACETSSFGGAYVVYNFNSLPGRSGNYAFGPIPHSVDSLYVNYVSSDYPWGRVGVTIGSTYTSKTSGNVENAVVYPSYFLENMSAFYQWGKNELDINVDNLTNKLYFTPDADSYVNLGALPGVGREWRLTFKRRF